MVSCASREVYQSSVASSLAVEPVPYASNGLDRIEGLFDKYSRLVLITAYRVLGDADEAEDIVQEVFLYLHRKSRLFDPARGSLKTWIIQIAVSRALDRKIYLSRHGFYVDADLDSLQLRHTADLEQQIESRLNRKYLEIAFSELTYMQRRTIEFFYFEGLNLKDISEQLQEPLGSVRHHLYRGLERLRKSSILHSLL
jgi:RNA polymerase sigma-70 factor (ECF subfamily)